MNFAQYVQRGMADVRSKTLNQIQIETALIWCGRACAAASLGKSADAHEYAHEAIEHAALAGDDTLLTSVRGMLKTYGVLY